MRRFLVDDSRAVLRLSGPDVRAFLQDLVTADVNRLEAGRAVYAALLTPQGKYLFDFLLVADGEDVLLDVAADRAAALAQRMTMYRLRRKVEIAPTDIRPVLIWPGEGPAPAEGAIPDPRDARLGWRLYGPAGGEDAEPGARADYEALRIALGIPETGIELIPEESYILEAGFEAMHGVDFRKGCYVGQEVTARMKLKTELRKGLARVAVDGPPPPPGTEILCDGRVAGKLFSVADGQGLAQLRRDRAGGEMQAGQVQIRLTGFVMDEKRPTAG